MKRLLFIMVIVNAVIISTLSSCNKNDSLPDPNTNVIGSQPPITLNLTAYHWAIEGNGVMVNTFANVIPPSSASRSVKVYLVTNDQEHADQSAHSFCEWRLVGDKHTVRHKNTLPGKPTKCPLSEYKSSAGVSGIVQVIINCLRSIVIYNANVKQPSFPGRLLYRLFRTISHMIYFDRLFPVTL